MSEKFCLKWNDFHANVSKSFKALRSADDFYDVTLVSDDQKQVSAHKIVLSASSEYFKNVLRSNKHLHPMLCLNGVSSNELSSILDYIYNGEIQIYQEQLDSFLQIAQRFQLEGLIQGEEAASSRSEPNEAAYSKSEPNEQFVEDYGFPSYGTDLQQTTETDRDFKIAKHPKERIIVESASGTELSIEDVDKRIEEIIERQQDGKYICLPCGKLVRCRAYALEHAEIHMDGLSFPCQHCDKTFRSRAVQRKHVKKMHE